MLILTACASVGAITTSGTRVVVVVVVLGYDFIVFVDVGVCVVVVGVGVVVVGVVVVVVGVGLLRLGVDVAVLGVEGFDELGDLKVPGVVGEELTDGGRGEQCIAP